MPNSQESSEAEGSFGTKRRRHRVVAGSEQVQLFSLGSKVAALRSVGSLAVLAMGAEPTVRRALDLGIGRGRSYKATLTIQDGVQLKGGETRQELWGQLGLDYLLRAEIKGSISGGKMLWT